MNNDVKSFIKLAISFLPFILFAFFNAKANVKKENRHRQYPMPVIAVVYSAVLLIFLSKISAKLVELFLKLVDVFERIKLPAVGEFILNIYETWGIYHYQAPAYSDFQQNKSP